MNSLNLSDDQLEKLTELGQVLFTPKECATFLMIPYQEFMEAFTDENDMAYLAYEKGRLLTLYEVRMNTYLMAKNGSSPAQTAIEKLIKDYEYQKKVEET